MTFQDYFPIWNKLQTDQQDRIRSNLNFRTVKKGTILHNGDMDCTGLLLVKAGQLRAYILSDEGREITIYRLFDRLLDDHQRQTLHGLIGCKPLMARQALPAAADAGPLIGGPGIHHLALRMGAVRTFHGVLPPLLHFKL